MTRREYLRTISGLGLALGIQGWNYKDDPLLQRAIPSSGEMLPTIGVGTWRTFDVSGSEAERAPLTEVLENLIKRGGKVVDSSPMYGESEKVLGDLSAGAHVNDKLFIATKVWTTGEQSGIRQMNDSFTFLKRKQIDLMQIHNLVDWKAHIKTLRAWKEQGKIRYIGLTHYLDSTHETLASILREEPVDFIQINYNLMDRNAEKRLLPFAQEKKVAVIVNRPFEEGALFQKVKGTQLPEWASEFDCTSWAQFFLKFILSNPAVTCTIPGTGRLAHLIDNLEAGSGRLPDGGQRQRMIEYVN